MVFTGFYVCFISEPLCSIFRESASHSASHARFARYSDPRYRNRSGFDSDLPFQHSATIGTFPSGIDA